MSGETGYEIEGLRAVAHEPEALRSQRAGDAEKATDRELSRQIEEFTRTFSDRWEW